MKYILFLITLMMISGCGRPPELVSVKETNQHLPCSGIVYNSRLIFSAAHCTPLDVEFEVTDSQGVQQSASIESVDYRLDAVALVVDEDLLLGEYPTFAFPSPGPAMAYGNCVEFSQVGRPMVYLGPYYYWDYWWSVLPVCGGDSGGLVMQRGEVVGMILAVDSADANGKARGHLVRTISVGVVNE